MAESTTLAFTYRARASRDNIAGSTPRASNNGPMFIGGSSNITSPMLSFRSSYVQNQSEAVNFTAKRVVPNLANPDQNGGLVNHSMNSQKQWQQQMKNGQIGIFGNYLASRISTIQQQQFLLSQSIKNPHSSQQNSARSNAPENQPASTMADINGEMTRSLQLGESRFGSVSTDMQIQELKSISKVPFMIGGQSKKLQARKEQTQGHQDPKKLRKQHRGDSIDEVTVEKARRIYNSNGYQEFTNQSQNEKDDLWQTRDRRKGSVSGSRKQNRNKVGADANNKSFKESMRNLLKMGAKQIDERVQGTSSIVTQQDNIQAKSQSSKAGGGPGPSPLLFGRENKYATWDQAMNQAQQATDSYNEAQRQAHQLNFPLSAQISSKNYVQEFRSQEQNDEYYATQNSLPKNLRSQSQTPHMQNHEINGMLPVVLKDSNPGSNQNGFVHRSFDQYASSNIGQKPIVMNGKISHEVNKALKDSKIVKVQNLEGPKPLNTLKPLKTSMASLRDQESSILSKIQTHREDQAKNYKGQQQIGMPLNGQLNVALRSNCRHGPGPCLEEKQMGVIDKIWGKFDSDVPTSKANIMAKNQKKSAQDGQSALALVHQNIKRNRNENTNTNPPSQLTDPQDYLRLQERYHSNAQKKELDHRSTEIQFEEAQTPVWLPRKAVISRNEFENQQDFKTNRKSGAIIESIQQAIQHSGEDNFDYQDFNFIVGKQKSTNTASNDNKNINSINSPSVLRNMRYQQVQQEKAKSMSENYHLMQQYGKKRLQSEHLAQVQSPIPTQKGNHSQPANIQIQIDNPQRIEEFPIQNSAMLNQMHRSSKKNLYKYDTNKNAYLSLSQKKKAQDQWNVPKPQHLKQQEFMQMHHVTIQIDPNQRQSLYNGVLNVSDQDIRQAQISPQPESQTRNKATHNIQNHNSVKQILPIKHHVIQGIPGNYQVNCNPFEPNPHYQTQQVPQLSLRGMISPRQLYSPELKLIEFKDESKQVTLPIIYPIIPKRQARQRINAASDLSRIDEKHGPDDLQIITNHSSLETSKEQAEAEKEKQPLVNEANPKIMRQRQPTKPYFCPYANSKNNSKLIQSKASASTGQSKASTTETAITEEQKAADLRSEEQKAEDLKNHQKELMRKYLSKFPPKKLPNLHLELEEERKRFLEARKDANKKYSEISANNNKPGKFAPLKFVVFEGNNSNIIRRIMQSRLACNMPHMDTMLSPANKGTMGDAINDQNFTTWEETNAPHLFNFKWKPTSSGINFERLGKFGYKQLVNHIEGHGALTTKDQLFFNMKAYCEKKNMNVFEMVPLTFAVDFREENQAEQFNRILHMISIFERNISLTPTELNQKLQSVQFMYDKSVRSHISVGPSEHKGKNLWLLKPTGFNRGIGIHVFNSCEDLQNILWTHYRINVQIPVQYRSLALEAETEHQSKDFTARDKEILKLSNQIAVDEQQENPEEKSGPGVKEIKNTSFIVQKYIEAPLLFKRRKFDIRIWALISHDEKLYLFKEAYVRTSSEEYDLSGEKLDQVYVHLTNNAVQKYSKNYGKFEEGNIISVKTLSAELASQELYVSSYSAQQIEQSLYAQMKEQILHSYEAVRSKLRFSKHSFELVGYDFMVVPQQDSFETPISFKTKMIEANTNPCIEESNTLLKKLVPRMLDDMLKLVLDPLFGTTQVPAEILQGSETGLPVLLNYPVEGYRNDVNMFDLIYNNELNCQ